MSHKLRNDAEASYCEVINYLLLIRDMDDVISNTYNAVKNFTQISSKSTPEYAEAFWKTSREWDKVYDRHLPQRILIKRLWEYTIHSMHSHWSSDRNETVHYFAHHATSSNNLRKKSCYINASGDSNLIDNCLENTGCKCCNPEILIQSRPWLNWVAPMRHHHSPRLLPSR